MWIIIIVIALFAASASAIDASNFANNAASDLGPLVTLFGENATTQFLKSSFSVFDSILFAMAPIGIPTAITSAIRVGSNKLLKTLIGQSRESFDAVEIELLSSTSQNVSETWNGSDLVKESGNGNVLEVVYLKALTETTETPMSQEPKDVQRDIEADLKVRIRFFYDLEPSIKNSCNMRDPEIGKVKSPGTQEMQYFAPNISLNFQNPANHSSAVIRGRPKKLRAVAAAFAVVLQTGVLAFFGVLTFKLNVSAGAGNPSPKVGFGLTFSGTIFMVLGMFICATVINQSTLEKNWSVEKRDEKRDSFELFWVQNRKSDQDGTESWILFSDEAHYVIVTSHPNKEKGIEFIKSTGVCFGVGFGISGFIMQLFGIRMMHWSAAIAQLVATFIMMTVRAVSQRQLSRSPEAWPLPDKHELDWVAMRLERNPATGDAPHLFKDNPNDIRVCCPKDNPDNIRVCYPNDRCALWNKGCWRWSVALDRVDRNENDEGFSKNPNLHDDSHHVFMVRQRLGNMSERPRTKWTTPEAKTATAISKVIDDIMGLLQLQAADPPLPQTKFWSMPVCVCVRGTKCQCNQSIYFQVHWDDKNRQWRSVPQEIEAFLSLWLFELETTVDSDSLRVRSCRLGAKNFHLQDDLRRWGGPEVKSILKMEESDFDGRYEQDAGNTELSNDQDTSNDEGGNADQGNEEGRNDERGGEDYGNDEGENEEGGNEEIRNEEEYDNNGGSQGREECKNDEVENGHSYEAQSNIMLYLEASLPTLCAHKLLFRFLQTVISDDIFVKINGDGHVQEDNTSKSWRDFRFQNDHITKLAQQVKASGLISFEHALVYLVAALSHKNKLPDCPGVLDYVRLRALDFKSKCQFSDGADIYKWLLLYYKGGSKQMTTGACALSFVFCEQLKEIIKVMQSEACIAANQEAAETEIKKANDALQEVLEVLRQMPGDIFKKLEDVYKIHKTSDDKTRDDKTHDDNSPDSSDFPRDWPDDLGWNAVHHSIANPRDCDCDFDKRLLNEPDKFGRTPLHEAAKRGLAKQTWSLIQKGSLLDVEDEEGKTALHVAAEYGQLEIVRILVLARASIYRADMFGKSALHWLAHAKTLHSGSLDEKVELKLQSLMVQFKEAIGLRDRNGRTALHLAAGLGSNHLLLEQLIQVVSRDDLNARDSRGMTPLHLAGQSGKDEAIRQLLLKPGAEINAPNWDQYTALHLAVENRHLATVELLLLRGANCEVNRYDTALHMAARAGNLPVAKLLVEKGANVYRKGFGKKTALHYAAKNNDEIMVDWLLLMMKGEHIDSPDNKLTTPLGAAVLNYKERIGLGTIRRFLREKGVDPLNAFESPKRGQWRNVFKLHAAAENGDAGLETLLKDGWKVDEKNEKGETALERAAGCGQTHAVRLLLQHMSDQSGGEKWINTAQLYNKARDGNELAVRSLLENGATVDSKDMDCRGPLSLAAEKGHLKVVELLVENNADVSSEDEHGQTALGFAARKGHSEVVRFLVAKKTYRKETDHEIAEAWRSAVEENQIEVMKVLLEAGVNVDLPVQDQRTALHLAASGGHADMVSWLVESGATLNTKSRSGKAALHFAVQAGQDRVGQDRVDQDRVVEFLLAKGADLNIGDNYGMTPLHYAAKGGDEKITQLLIKKGAKIDTKADAGENRPTALDLAVNRGHSAVMEVLLEASTEGLDDVKTRKIRNEYQKVYDEKQAAMASHNSYHSFNVEMESSDS